MTCPECLFPLRISDLSFGICWRCGVILPAHVERVIVPVDIAKKAVDRAGDSVDTAATRTRRAG